MDTQATETKRLLLELGAHARRVADEEVAHDGAIGEERRARAELVAAVVDAVRPALPALCSRVVVESPGDGTTKAAAWSGLYLASDRGRARGPHVSQLADDRSRGRYGGEDLYVREDGTFVQLVYDGPWSSVPGERSAWQAVAVVLESLDVVELYSESDVLDSIGAALVQQIGDQRSVVDRKVVDRRKSTINREIVERADRIHAVTVLLKAVL